MQTPGSNVQSNTPMIPMERRMDAAYERILKTAEDNVQVSRPEIRSLGRIILQMEQINNNMVAMQREIRSDIRERQKYFREEQKILKKDSENLNNIRTAALFGARSDIAAILGGLSALEFSRGNIGGGFQAGGLALGTLIPEIASGVVGLLALRGVLPRNSTAMGGGVGVTRGMGGVGKFKNPLLMTAALAATLLLGNRAAASGQDRRRGELVSQEVGRKQTINENDVGRFRGQLTRFEGILDRSISKKDSKISTVTPGLDQDIDQDMDEILTGELPSANAVDQLNNISAQQSTIQKTLKGDNEKGKPKGFMRGLAGTADFLTGDLFDFDNRGYGLMMDGNSDDKSTTQRNGDQSRVMGNDNGDLASNTAAVNNLTSMLSGKNTDSKESIGSILEIDPEKGFSDIDITGLLENKGEKSEKNWFQKLFLPKKKQNVASTSGSKTPTVNVFENEGTTQQMPSSPSEYESAPASAFVATEFTDSGGAYDKFDYASSLNTYAAFTTP